MLSMFYSKPQIKEAILTDAQIIEAVKLSDVKTIKKLDNYLLNLTAAMQYKLLITAMDHKYPEIFEYCLKLLNKSLDLRNTEPLILVAARRGNMAVLAILLADPTTDTKVKNANDLDIYAITKRLYPQNLAILEALLKNKNDSTDRRKNNQEYVVTAYKKKV